MSIFHRLFGLLNMDIGIDLGTANTLVYVKDEGIKVRQPSVVAVKKGSNEVVAVGDDAKRMLGRTPDTISAVRPLRDGVIADFEMTEAMLKHFIKEARTRDNGKGTKIIKASKIRVVVAVPSGITEVEKRAVKDSARHAGADEVYLIEEPMAAAIGVGLPIQDASGNMIVDIGGGTTEIAVIALSGVVTKETIRVAGDEMDEALEQWFRNEHKLDIGISTGEAIKKSVGSAMRKKSETISVKGRDLVSGIPKTIEVTSDEVRQALKDPVSMIVEAVKKALERTPPELSADILDRGIIMTGGGSKLKGMDQIIRERTNVPVNIAEDPLLSVVRGTGMVLEDIKKYEAVLI
mgnify:CR=1 FL=1